MESREQLQAITARLRTWEEEALPVLADDAARTVAAWGYLSAWYRRGVLGDDLELPAEPEPEAVSDLHELLDDVLDRCAGEVGPAPGPHVAEDLEDAALGLAIIELWRRS